LLPRRFTVEQLAFMRVVGRVAGSLCLCVIFACRATRSAEHESQRKKSAESAPTGEADALVAIKPATDVPIPGLSEIACIHDRQLRIGDGYGLGTQRLKGFPDYSRYDIVVGFSEDDEAGVLTFTYDWARTGHKTVVIRFSETSAQCSVVDKGDTSGPESWMDIHGLVVFDRKPAVGGGPISIFCCVWDGLAYFRESFNLQP
jgi:hypothetical protein